MVSLKEWVSFALLLTNQVHAKGGPGPEVVTKFQRYSPTDTCESIIVSSGTPGNYYMSSILTEIAQNG